MRVQPELARVERAVLDAEVQGKAHQINVVDSALFQVTSQSGVPAMRVVEKCAVAVDLGIDSLMEHMSYPARVE